MAKFHTPDRPVGSHCILELQGCPFHLLDHEAFIRRAITEASQRGMSTLLELSSYKFEPQGVTALGLLSESHISIHTWPEDGYAAVDVFTCGEAQPVLACHHLVEVLEASDYALKVLPRGMRPGKPQHIAVPAHQGHHNHAIATATA